MRSLRTPDHRFADLPVFDYSPHYLMIDDGDGGQLRMHYLDEGDPQAQVILCLHGEPSWCYLYRKMIPVFTQAGYRVLAPDLIGFGRSDKPTERADYTYASHLHWLGDWFKQMHLDSVVLVCQDWGGLLGLRLLVNEPERFGAAIIANTLLPTGDQPPSAGFLNWQVFSQEVPEFPAGGVIKGGTEMDIEEAGVEEGMQTLRRVAILNVLKGVTAVEDVFRVTAGGH